MRIAILGAISEEIQALKENLVVERIEYIAGREFFCGKLYGVDAVLVFSRVGKVASAATATILISIFDVDYLYFTGVAGALDTNVEIGDVVIAEKLYQHDLDPRPIFKLHQVPLTNKIFFTSDTYLNDLAYRASDKFLSQIDRFIHKEDLSLFNIKKPKIQVGIVATGDQFISSSDQINKIKNEMQDVLAVEMEGAAVAHVCYEHRVPFSVIRVISDKSNKSAHVDFTSFVNIIFKQYIVHIIRNIFQSLK